MTCPACKSNKIALEIELREVYDGISFYRCECGAVYSRWTGEIVPGFDEMSYEDQVEIGMEQRRRVYE